MELIEVSWQALKTNMLSKNLTRRLQWIQEGDVYRLFLFDGPMNLSAKIKATSPKNADQHDFELFYKAQSNQILNPLDSDGSQIIKQRSTKSGWHYEPNYISFATAQYNSVYAKHAVSGDDTGEVSIHFYRQNGEEIKRSQYITDEDYQLALAECAQTFIDWTPDYDYDIRGGKYISGASRGKAYAFVVAAPLIPAFLGGQVPLINGGIPLHLLRPGEVIEFEGVTALTVRRDPMYKSHMIRVIIRHDAGAQIEGAICFEKYKL